MHFNWFYKHFYGDTPKSLNNWLVDFSISVILKKITEISPNVQEKMHKAHLHFILAIKFEEMYRWKS